MASEPSEPPTSLTPPTRANLAPGEYITSDAPPTTPQPELVDLARRDARWPQAIGIVCIVLGSLNFASELGTLGEIVLGNLVDPPPDSVLLALRTASSVSALVLAVYVIWGGLLLNARKPTARMHLIRFAWMYGLLVVLNAPLTFLHAQEQTAELLPGLAPAGLAISVVAAVIGSGFELALLAALLIFLHSATARNEVSRWQRSEQAWFDMRAEHDTARAEREARHGE